MKQKRLGKRIAAWLVCLAMVLTTINLPAFTLEVKAVDRELTPLTFTAQEPDSAVTLSWVSGDNVQYSKDGGLTWETYVNYHTIVLANAGDKVSFRGNSVKTSQSKNFYMRGKIAASGDVTSLTNNSGGDTNLEESCYAFMFSGCKCLTSAPELPATTLADNCYSYMFNECTGLTSAPALPATTLKKGCYDYMFSGCTSLTSAPKLSAMTLAEGCYKGMFNECTSLTSAPKLPATTLKKNCYAFMFSECTGLTNAPELSATTLALNCCSAMFSGCTSLTSAPELPAMTLETTCYASMFEKCTSLTSAPKLPATTLAESCYDYMFSGCTSLTSAPELPAMTLETTCYGSMFSGCTSLTSAPKLPATTLARDCYDSMFLECTGLTSAPELPVMTLARDCYASMFSGCTSLTSAPKLPATTLEEGCYYSMFSGCTSLTSAPELPAATLAEDCYAYMFSRCTGLTSAPELPATTLVDGCYYSMFAYCTNLKVVETTEESEATWKFSSTGAKNWNYMMIDGLTATDTLTEVEAGKMYKVTHVNHDFTDQLYVADVDGIYHSQKCKTCNEYSAPELCKDSLVPVAKVDATCEEAGNIAYFKCSKCGAYYADENATEKIADQKSVVIPAKKHSLSKVEKIDATCTTAGCKEYWKCTNDACGKIFADKDGNTSTTLLDLAIAAKGHTWNTEYTVDVEPTTEAEGSKSIHCGICGAIKEGSAVTIPKSEVKPTPAPTAGPSGTPTPTAGPSGTPAPTAGPSGTPTPTAVPSGTPSSELKSQKITTAKIKAVKAKSLKKKAVTIKLKAKTDGKGKLTYKVTGYPKKMKKFIKVSKKGVVTLKKKAKKGTYKITITAAAKGDYKKTTKVVSIKVK